MKHVRRLALASLLTIAFGVVSIRAQVTSVEHINTVVTSFAPWEGFFPNVYHPTCPKELRFEGVASGGGDPATFPGTLWIQFDWIDPVHGVVYSPAWPFLINSSPELTPIFVEYRLPFCPEQVSLHFATDVPLGGVVNIAGDFTHNCIPEPSSFATVGALGLMGFLVSRRCRSRDGAP